MKITATCTLGLTLGLILLSTTSAFGDEAAAPKVKAASPGAAEAATAPAKIDWNAMDKKQRKAYMKKTVLPAAQKMFAEFDAKKYKRVTCVTCHGEGAGADFKMPNPELPKLPTSPEGFKALQEKKPDMVKFMGTKVKPTVAALLGLPEWTPAAPQGFGCYNCHEKDVAAKAPASPAK
jgi:mono/diheme cytochrome c family protein